MADDLTPSRMELVNIEATVPEPDSLIAGPGGFIMIDVMRVEDAGEYKRGTLFMRSTGEQKFTPATKDGLANAKEIAILCDNITISEGEYSELMAYFDGEFNADKIILPWEDSTSDHDTEIDAVRSYLRSHGIYLR